MPVNDFQYYAPASMEEASRLLGMHSNARLFCGGTDLLAQLYKGAVKPAPLINIKKIPELNRLTITHDRIVIGAAIPCSVLAARADLKQRYPGLVEALQLIGSVQIQNRASVGGNLCNASPAADTVPALIANAAQCRLYSLSGERTVPVEGFISGPGRTVLKAGEFLLDITLPIPAREQADAYLRLIPRSEMDIAIAGAAVSLQLDNQDTCADARVAIGAVAPKALLVTAAAELLKGTKLDAATLTEFERIVRAAAAPLTDKRSTCAYRVHVIGVLARRAALIAAGRAREDLH